MNSDVNTVELSVDYKQMKLMEFFRNEKFTDCTFIVEGVNVKAHKLVLACCSPVFEKMLFGDMHSSEIVVCDINLEDFTEVIEYLYTERLKIDSVSHAWSLFYVGHKYLLEELTGKCLNYIYKNLTMANLLLSYEFADMYNLLDLKKRCFKDINDFLGGVFVSDYHMKPSTLCAILKQNAHVMSNFELVLRILEWSAVECDYKKQPVLTENMINILREYELLKFIKLSWIKNVHNLDVSTFNFTCSNEIVQKALHQLEKIVDGSQSDSPKKSNCTQIRSLCSYRSIYKIAKRIDLQEAEENISTFSVSQKVMLFAFVIATPMKPSCTFTDYFKGTLTIRICKQASDTQIGTETVSSGLLIYDDDICVKLKDVIILYPYVIYDVKISFTNSCLESGLIDGMSMVSNYMSCTLYDIRRVTNISFFETAGGIIKGVCFYPA